MFHSRQKRHPIDRACTKILNKAGIISVIATLSGGADSVALTNALSRTGISVIAAHCNFHLRGEESMRDQAHVEKLCRSLGLKLELTDFNVNEYISSHPGTSVEMACRELRHNWFKELASVYNADRIATGHNADDNIETLFLNLMRGTGTNGLKGMLPDTGTIIRPLLSFHRKDIISYLDLYGLEYVTDSTNLESDYRRNFLRNEIIPLLKSRWEGFDKALDKSMQCLRDEHLVINKTVTELLPSDGEILTTDTIIKFPAPELLVRRYIEPLKPFSTTAAEVISSIYADKPDRRTWRLRNGTLILQNHKLIRQSESESPDTHTQ